jgi:uncharacterized PurR-regulated membrane protein YhhQ (DUF165 family)
MLAPSWSGGSTPGTGAARALGWSALAAYVAAIALANLLLAEGIFVDLGFGLVAPAAVFAVGATFTLRDAVQSTLGYAAALAAIAGGGALSALFAPRFALVSAVAFLAGELVDLAVYTPLRRRSWLVAVALSNTAGLLLDSWLFLTLAFGSLALLPGQVVGKALTTALAVVPAGLWQVWRGAVARHA